MHPYLVINSSRLIVILLNSSFFLAGCRPDTGASNYELTSKVLGVYTSRGLVGQERLKLFVRQKNKDKFQPWTPLIIPFGCFIFLPWDSKHGLISTSVNNLWFISIG